MQFHHQSPWVMTSKAASLGLTVQFAGIATEESPLPSDFYCLYNLHKGLVSLVIS